MFDIIYVFNGAFHTLYVGKNMHMSRKHWNNSQLRNQHQKNDQTKFDINKVNFLEKYHQNSI